jgi:hypothetical protein
LGGVWWIVAQKRKENEESKNKDKKKVMVKLKIIIIMAGTTTTKSSVCLAKVLGLFLWHPILVLMLGILDFVGKGAAPFVGKPRGRDGWGFFLAFLGLMG